MQSISVVIPVYKDRERALAAVASLRRQVLPRGVRSEIIVVDDGSGDDTPDFIRSRSVGITHLVELRRNSGRAAACNAGAYVSSGEVLFFVACDCLAVGDQLFMAHLAALDGCVASTGPVVGTGTGFWDRYQRDSAMRRERLHRRGITYAGSSSNLAVLRSAFMEIGGFDAGYQRYGFEDRDLLLRLAALGAINWTDRAVVQHVDMISLRNVTRKMTEAGKHSAPRFRNRHPIAYRELGYAALDAHGRRWMRSLVLRFGPGLTRFAEAFDPLLAKPWIPYYVAKPLVKLIGAASFMYGTAQLQTDDGRSAGASMGGGRSNEA